MNYIVLLDKKSGEFEKILSGVKRMLMKDFNPEDKNAQAVKPGDSLYFLRDTDTGNLRVMATVVRVQHLSRNDSEDLTHAIKEMQPRLQLTEDEYKFWSSKEQVEVIEFDTARKITTIPVSLEKIAGVSGWIAVEDLGPYKV